MIGTIVRGGNAERCEPALSDPAPEAEWEVWYQDTFDRECPPSVDVSGRGLAEGLIQLWARHLFESVQVDGRSGFSRFHLWWKQRQRAVNVVGDREGAARLRGWVFGAKQHTDRGYVEAGDAHLLEMVAVAHARLVLANQSSERILGTAKTAVDRQDFEVRLGRLVA